MITFQYWKLPLPEQTIGIACQRARTITLNTTVYNDINPERMRYYKAMLENAYDCKLEQKGDTIRKISVPI